MQRVSRFPVWIAIAAAIVAMAMATATTARFAAGAPGTDLDPIGDAARVVHLIQGQESIVWVSLVGPVTQVTAWGWPTSDGEVELGGGMTITRPDGGESGTIDFGDKPMAVTFETGS